MASDKSKTFLKKDELRSYLNKDFNSFRGDLLQYAKTFFPDKIQDFSENSVGGMLLDLAAYVGDVMTFYMDHQFNELNIETAVERKNIEKLVRSSGIKITGAAPAVVDVRFYIEAETDTSDADRPPMKRYLPKIKAGTTVVSSSGITFRLLEDLDFAAVDIAGNTMYERVSVIDSDGGGALSLNLKMTGVCQSGKTITEKFTIPNTFAAFRTIKLSNKDVADIVSVKDASGNIYYEVDSLTQNVVYKRVANLDSDQVEVPDQLEIIPAPYRFTTTVSTDTRMTTIRFGSGRADTLDDDIIPDPSELALPLYQKKTFSRFSIDPNNLLKTRTLGISPQNTTITVTYRAGGGRNHNVSAQSIRTVGTLLTEFHSTVAASTRAKIRSSLEVSNEFEAAGGEAPPTVSELRAIALSAKNSQNRIVTKEDLIARIYTMPPSFGRVYRVAVSPNEQNPLASLLYIISRNKQGQLVTSPNTLKQNLKTYLNDNRLIADSIDMLSAYVINLAVTYNVVVDSVSNKALVIQSANDAIKRYMSIENFQIEQPLIITDLENIVINTEGVVSLVSFSVTALQGKNENTGNEYSDYFFDVAMHTDRKIVYPTQGGIFEVKYPNDDIIGTTI